MKILLITNIIVQWVVIGIIVWRTTLRGRLEWTWRTSFFGKTRYGGYITLWTLPLGVYPNEGQSIFSLQWRNEKSIKDHPYIKDARKWATPSITQLRCKA